MIHEKEKLYQIQLMVFRHKNPLVRATVSRLLNYIVNAIGVETLLSTTTTKDTRSRVFSMCANFLVDGDSETRYILFSS